MSLGLSECGLDAGDRVAIIAESRPEWCTTDLAVLAAGGVTVPVYPTLTVAQVHDILDNCGAKIAVVSNRTQVDKIVATLAQLPGLRTIAVMDPDGPWPQGVTTLADVAARGRRHLASDMAAAQLFEERAIAIARDALATISTRPARRASPRA